MGADRERVVKTLCGMCSITCAMEIHLENREIKKIKNPEGHFLKSLCPKPILGWKDYQYSRERIVNPLRKVEGEWKEISWDDALTIIADKLHETKKQYGPESLVVHLGNAHVFQQTENIAHRFCDVHGTPNFTTGASYCHFGRVIGNGLTFEYNSFGIFAYPMYRGTKCMVIWGTNPVESAKPISGVIPLLKTRGAKLIVIDPRKTALAKEADIHAQPRPGTDCALALALINVIISEELYDKSFVENYTVGFEQLVDHVKPYTPEKVEEITWVPANIIREIARTYSTSEAAALAQGVSLEHCTNGTQASRATAILIAITGNINKLGGNYYYPSFPGDTLRIPEKVTAEPYCGYPIFTQFVSEIQDAPFAESVLSEKPYSIKALIVQGSNPLLTSPNSNNLKRAYEKLDLLVVIDHFMTDTTRLADVVLPPTTFLERSDILRVQGRPLIDMRTKVLDPPENCREDWKIWSDLARKMGYEEYFPWESVHEVIESILKPTGITIAQIKENVNGFEFAEVDVRKYLEQGFDTPSGKVEIYSKTLEEHGYAPLPTYEEPAESPLSRPDLAEKYSLVLTIGALVRYYTHSRYRNLPALRKNMPEPLVEINTKTALDRGISDGDRVVVESPRGSIELKASVTEDILPGVISLLHGWSQANSNLLTDDGPRDPISGFPGFKSLICDVRRA
jgi:anaerobic selenocysteine-containing dehydrogenase